MLPPRWVRRVVVAPAIGVGIAIGLFSAPLWLLGAAAISPLLPGRWRPLRFLWFVVVYAALELVCLLALLGLWVATGFGAFLGAPWSQRAHYALIKWFLRALEWEARRVLGVRIVVEGPPPSEYHGRPLVVMARHAGPGDSFLVVHSLMNWCQRDPRIVLKDTLQWDPVTDIVLNRLPNRFIAPNPGDGGAEVERHIRELATRLDHNSALVIFPEGGNFTPRRRLRAIDRLRQLGHDDAAAQAERMENVLAPRPGGVAAALGTAIDADAVFVAHTGLEHLDSVADLWRGLPMDTEIRMHWWRVPAADVPRNTPDVTDWLFGWWEQVDAWIGAHRPVP
ncbi:MAG: lysophospholipid acyltransferase family protein [Jiangellaceae bacterium]